MVAKGFRGRGPSGGRSGRRQLVQGRVATNLETFKAGRDCQLGRYGKKLSMLRPSGLYLSGVPHHQTEPGRPGPAVSRRPGRQAEHKLQTAAEWSAPESPADQGRSPVRGKGSWPATAVSFVCRRKDFVGKTGSVARGENKQNSGLFPAGPRLNAKRTRAIGRRGQAGTERDCVTAPPAQPWTRTPARFSGPLRFFHPAQQPYISPALRTEGHKTGQHLGSIATEVWVVKVVRGSRSWCPAWHHLDQTSIRQKTGGQK